MFQLLKLENLNIRECGLSDEIFENIEPDVQHLLKSPLRFAQNKSRRCTQLDKDFFSQALMHFRNLQGHEVWQTHQQWIRQHRPVFAKGVGDRATAGVDRPRLGLGRKGR